MKTVAKAGGVAAIHAEDNDIVMFMYEKLMRENRVGFEYMAEVHNTLSEELSFNRVIRLAERVEGDEIAAICGRAGLTLSERMFRQLCATAPYVDAMVGRLRRDPEFYEEPASVVSFN